jgi:hypothetical protein
MHRSVNKNGEGQVMLNQVNFVSRYSLLLFGGDLSVEGNNVCVGRFLKFKIGSGGEEGSLLVRGLRRMVELMLLERLAGGEYDEVRWRKTIEIIVKLMVEEKN